ncbi:MAG: hypothetical protein HOI34_09975 [Rhodospirillaceae bacterium]|nr:hypothetical protein [Rhodospirillaceae bacterium]MBT7613939.1 hypothetical protein [Rhodospirillaceae bacterium]
MAKKFIFPIKTGRSGTAYLAELFRRNLPDADVWHERTGFATFGVDTPDLSHLMLFNSVGNVDAVQAFWRQKFTRDLTGDRDVHAEASHFLAKAGLLENIDFLLAEGAEVEIVILRRDVFATLWSFYNRFDFVNNGLAWAFYLDAKSPNAIADSRPFLEHGVAGKAIWYIVEMRARGAYCRQLMGEIPGLRFHTADLRTISKQAGAKALLRSMDLAPEGGVNVPPPRNDSKANFFGDKERDSLIRLRQRFDFNEEELAAEFIRRGWRLGDGPEGLTRPRVP